MYLNSLMYYGPNYNNTCHCGYAHQSSMYVCTLVYFGVTRVFWGVGYKHRWPVVYCMHNMTIKIREKSITIVGLLRVFLWMGPNNAVIHFVSFMRVLRNISMPKKSIACIYMKCHARDFWLHSIRCTCCKFCIFAWNLGNEICIRITCYFDMK